MAKIIEDITVEVVRPNLFQAVVAKQNDCNSRFLKATFINKGEKIDITPASKVTLNVCRPDGESKSFEGVINDDATVTVPLHSWVLGKEGMVDCDISVIDENDEKLTSTKFLVFVEKATCSSEDIVNDPQYDVLTDLINTVSNIEKWEEIITETIPEAETVETVSETTHKDYVEENGGYYAETLNTETNVYSLSGWELEHCNAGDKYNVYTQSGEYVGYFVLGELQTDDESGLQFLPIETEVPYLAGYNGWGDGFYCTECGYGEPYVFRYVSQTKAYPVSYTKDLKGKYKKLAIFITLAYDSNYKSKGYINGYANDNSTGFDNGCKIFSSDAVIPMPTTSGRFTLVKISSEMVGKKAISTLQYLANTTETSGRYLQTTGDLANTWFPIKKDYIETLKLQTVTMAFTKGTKIEIYGIKAN